MGLGALIPITAIIATAAVMLAVIRFWRERLRVEDGNNTGPAIADAEENARLAHENESLRLSSKRLEERLAVLERIATDPAERTAREIERLR
jgi:hypothetical protein